jgi:hypothetical protein
MRKVVVFVVALAIAPGVALAQPAGEPAPALSAAESVRDNLERLRVAGKPVELVLKNGKSYAGRLGAVGEHAVIVTEIRGKEFYDAYVVLDDVSAVEVRMRDR